MDKITTIAVDDEPLALRLLASTLEKIPSVELVATCSNGRQAIEAIAEHGPQLMFLDINMPGMSGFEVVKRVQPEMLPLVVFCTAYDQYALQAFEVYAVDYVLKPFDEERIALSVRRARDRMQGEWSDQSEKPQLLGAIDRIDRQVASESGVTQADAAVTESSQPKTIAIKDGDAYTILPEADIEWVDAAGDYMCVHAAGETHILRSTMKNLLEDLNGDLFKRVHRSTIVNLARIKQVIPHTKGDYFLRLDNDERIKVSRNYRDAIKDFLADRQID